MEARGVRRASRAVALACGIVLILGLTFTGAHADIVGCSFTAPATVGTADLIPGVSPPPGTPPEVAGAIGTVGFLLDSGSAACFTLFTCPASCSLFMQFGFGGAGLIAGEVTIHGSQLTEVARETCGPTLGTPVGGGCGGSLQAPLGSGSFLLECRAHGVVAILVSGFCQGSTT